MPSSTQRQINTKTRAGGWQHMHCSSLLHREHRFAPCDTHTSLVALGGFITRYAIGYAFGNIIQEIGERSYVNDINF